MKFSTEGRTHDLALAMLLFSKVTRELNFKLRRIPDV